MATGRLRDGFVLAALLIGATAPVQAATTTLKFAASTVVAGEGGGFVRLTVSRSGATSLASSVHYATAPGSATVADYTPASGTLSWAAGDLEPKFFTVAIADDATVDPDETFTVTLSAPTGGTLGSPSTATVTIADNDPMADTGNPILFVTQVPVATFLGVDAPFGAHEGHHYKAPRGGDLMIRYPDGTLRNLTQEAGYGATSSFQGGAAIAVRQPTLHWSGQKALFSMVIGGNPQQYKSSTAKWQIYEITGFLQGQTVQISKVAGQPTTYNNIAPLYGSDDQIIFVSDRPRNGSATLYPQRDEYESANIESGLWKLDPVTLTLKLLEHAPSGVTYPSVDSYGRLIFTKWDHLQRDQQADHDAFGPPDDYKYGAFNYDSEAQTTPPATWSIQEYFPEFRLPGYSVPWYPGWDGTQIDPAYPYAHHTFNQFFPWMLNQDGTGEETLNHVGRHELGGTYTDGSFRNDPELTYVQAGQFNGATYFLRGDGGVFHLRENPVTRGQFFASEAPEFSTGAAGNIVRISGSPSTNPETMKVTLVMSSAAKGRMRNPLPLANGGLVVSHTWAEETERNLGTSTAPQFNYAFRLRATRLDSAGKRVLDGYLTPGVQKTLTWWSPDEKVTWSGQLWELDPVEVRARTAPKKTVAPSLPAPEQQALTEAGVNATLLRNWLHSKKLALVISRDVTTRDRADEQQPYNLQVPGGVMTVDPNPDTPNPKIYDVVRQQFFQGDQIRGYASGKPPQQGGTPSPGRRVLAVPLHDGPAVSANPKVPAGVAPGSFAIGLDGSTAAFLPAQRATTWQLVDGNGQPIVRERNWLSFGRGEIRVCTSCHGINTQDQAAHAAPQNKPEALVSLLQNWKSVVRNKCAATGGTGTWTYTGVAYSACDEGSQYRIQVCSGGNSCCDGMPQTQAQACP